MFHAALIIPLLAVALDGTMHRASLLWLHRVFQRLWMHQAESHSRSAPTGGEAFDGRPRLAPRRMRLGVCIARTSSAIEEHGARTALRAMPQSEALGRQLDHYAAEYARRSRASRIQRY